MMGFFCVRKGLYDKSQYKGNRNPGAHQCFLGTFGERAGWVLAEPGQESRAAFLTYGYLLPHVPSAKEHPG